MALPTPKFTTIKNAYLLKKIKAFTQKEYSSENFEFYFDKSSNHTLYDKYIKEDSPRQVNLPARLRKPLDVLAAQRKWSAMSAGIKEARAEIASLLDKDTMTRFAATPDGEAAIVMVEMGIDGSKEKQVIGLLQVYEKGRTPSDKYQAYQALVKLGNQGKVNRTLAAMGMPPPSKAPAGDEAQVARNLKTDKLAKELKTAIPKTMEYFKSANDYLKKNGPPSDQLEQRRMFESGRMRHDKIYEIWGQAVRGDKEFSKKYPDVVKLNKQLEDAYSTFRRYLKR